MAPVEVSEEPHGRLPSYLLAEGLEPTADFVLQGLFWLTLAIVAIALVDLVARGRFRNVSSTLAGMLGALGPLLGVYAAANILMSASLNVQDTRIWPGIVGQSALLVAIGALCGCVGVVLVAVLRIIPAKHRSRLAGTLDQSDATKS
ncbi:MAG: hypothetical protein Q7U72_00565 [Brevundimonas sp.]|uniref:hypothetical protein n=1 Tax=Brevundimonas sp. TaxID=1871086 RepID=UPI002722DFDC|nr:hypothetical protein [Brevundimonas sp.]MDO9075925.1 hypothetical protein [Brevundimonas sp.]MDP3081836.1 hypothetical protein [Brevundimonas sp.]MDZ4059686.1 hypothetical protein [Brevundimonas sp.]